MEEKISIIIPVYKVEEYLDYCVESVVKQTYNNLEIILVDDGSPDRCPKMCDEWAKKDKRIKVIHKKNAGVSQARNSGLEIATGKFVAFIDSDDTISLQMFEILMKTIADTKSDMSVCSWKKVYDISKPNNKDVAIEKIKIKSFENDEVFDLLFNKKVPLIMAVWAKLYKKSLFDGLKYPSDIAIGEDEFMIPYVLDRVKKLSFVDLPLYNNTQRETSVTAGSFSIKRMGAVIARKDRWQFCAKNKPEFEQKALAQYLLTLAIFYTKFKKTKADKKLLSELLSEFNDCYKLLKKKNILIRIFKNSKSLFAFMLAVKEKI